jgi:two-component system sensor histidine kinase AdeS
MKLVGLSRQIVLSMTAIALGVALLVILTAYLFYFIWDYFWPDYKWPENNIVPTGPEWLWIGGTTLVGLALAVLVAVKLSQRILVPLNSVTDGIRRLAQGDLGARAIAGDRSLGEASLLADDFNALAIKLERMTEEQVFWNAAIAHELRTPVTILRGRLQGLAEGVFTPDAAQFRSLLTQVEGLASLIEDLRVVSLGESGTLALQIQHIDLAEEIEAVVEMVGSTLESAGHRIVLRVDGARGYGDPIRLRQALLALLENVRKHAAAGEVVIEADCRADRCRIGVRDAGPGIAEAFLPQAFTAFRRGGNATSSGSGLGLAVVAAIAKAHGGTVECRNLEGGGSIFELTWPNQFSASEI